MKRSAKVLTVVGILFAIVIAARIYLEFTEEYETDFIVSSAARAAGINNIEIGIKQNTIFVYISTDKSITCKDAIAALGITSLPINGKIYKPVCTKVSESFIRIMFKPVIDV